MTSLTLASEIYNGEITLSSDSPCLSIAFPVASTSASKLVYCIKVRSVSIIEVR